MSVQKILLIQTSFIGDIILLSTVIENMRTHLGEICIDILINQHSGGLYQGHPYVGKAWVWNKKENKHKNLVKLIASIRKEKYDMVINFHRFFSTGLLTASSGAKFKAGFSDNPFSFLYQKSVPFPFEKGLHEVDRNHSLLRAAFPVLKEKELTRRPVLYPSQEDVDLVKKYQDNPYLCLCPSSVWFTKQFPKERWMELISLLPSETRIYLLGAPGDHALCEEIREGTDERVVNLSGKLSLLQSAALMKGAVINYVNDSAPLHLASAMNAPVCAFFCSTVTDFGFYPLSEFSWVVEIEDPLYCRPCGKHGYQTCPEGHFKCALNIPVQKAIHAYEEAKKIYKEG
jgi:heptosyltransferase II